VSSFLKQDCSWLGVGQLKAFLVVPLFKLVHKGPTWRVSFVTFLQAVPLGTSLETLANQEPSKLVQSGIAWSLAFQGSGACDKQVLRQQQACQRNFNWWQPHFYGQRIAGTHHAHSVPALPTRPAAESSTCWRTGRHHTTTHLPSTAGGVLGGLLLSPVKKRHQIRKTSWNIPQFKCIRYDRCWSAWEGNLLEVPVIYSYSQAKPWELDTRQGNRLLSNCDGHFTLRLPDQRVISTVLGSKQGLMKRVSTGEEGWVSTDSKSLTLGLEVGSAPYLFCRQHRSPAFRGLWMTSFCKERGTDVSGDSPENHTYTVFSFQPCAPGRTLTYVHVQTAIAAGKF
jgi:hypothetical protein